MADWGSLALAGVNTAAGLVQAGARQKAEASAAAAEAQARGAALNREEADAAALREKKLELASSTARARAAAGGMGADGSAAAILAGMNADNADQALRDSQRYQAAREDVSRTAGNHVRMSLLDFNERRWNSLMGAGRSAFGFFDAQSRQAEDAARRAEEKAARKLNERRWDDSMRLMSRNAPRYFEA
jgi:hypothetical protein